MNTIFIEAEKKETAEYSFLTTVMARYFPDVRYELIPMDGVGKNQQKQGIEFPFFLYPDNGSDGDVEHLMESLARQDLHPTFFNCFRQYEMCVGGDMDEQGRPRYNTPDLKGKLHTYMSAQKLSNAHRRRLGRGDWLFDDIHYWDLGREAIQPLVNFLRENLK